MAKHPIPETRWPTAEEAAASLLFSSLRIGSLVARHRTWVPAMVPWRATADGFVTPEVLAWYRRFAQGRPAVLVVEATGIRDIPSGPLLRIGHERFLPGLRELVATVRAASHGETRLLIQIIDFLTIRRRPPRERYLLQYLVLRDSHRQALEQDPACEGLDLTQESVLRQALLRLPDERLLQVLSQRESEDLRMGYRERLGDLHLDHIRRLPEVLPALFARAAEIAREAGFDGVELHYAHAYTMASFLSRLNQRTDGYGGSPENRVRLPLEVYGEVRRAVGADYTLGCRFLGDEVIEGGSRVEDAAFYGEQFARAGMDFLSISKGGKFEDARQPAEGEAAYPYTGPSGHECMPTVHCAGVPPFGRNLPLAAAVRHRVRSVGLATPVVAAGGFNSFELAETALQRGDCDMVGAARQSLADPDWFRKVRLGRGAEVRRCLFTNYCEALDQKHREVTCQRWDREHALEDAPGRGIALARDGRRRLVAPPWEPGAPEAG